MVFIGGRGGAEWGRAREEQRQNRARSGSHTLWPREHFDPGTLRPRTLWPRTFLTPHTLTLNIFDPAHFDPEHFWPGTLWPRKTLTPHTLTPEHFDPGTLWPRTLWPRNTLTLHILTPKSKFRFWPRMNPKGKKMASGLFPAVLGSYEGLYRQKSTVTSLGCNKDYLLVWIHLFATLARPWARFYATFTFSVQ